MTIINAYSTLQNTLELNFPHKLNVIRDRKDPALLDHLQGFIGYILQSGSREVTSLLYFIYRHIERTQVHYSFEVEEADLKSFSEWAWKANAIIFLEDGTIRDPNGLALLYPDGKTPDQEARLPFPDDTFQRKEKTEALLKQHGIEIPTFIPPVVGNDEVALRTPEATVLRLFALIAVVLRADSFTTETAITAEELKKKFPLSFEALTPGEEEFMNHDDFEDQLIVDLTWRLEAITLLFWALKLTDQLPFPDKATDMSALKQKVNTLDFAKIRQSATLRDKTEILDALDLHYRAHWLIRQAEAEGKEEAGNLMTGVVSQRHHTLNWLTQFQDAAWDDVDTPT